MLGIDFGGTKIAAAVCDLAGNKLAVRRGRQPRRARRAGQLRPRHADRTATCWPDCAAQRPSLAAVGVATFGIPFEDRVELAPAIDGWDALALGRELRAAFPGAAIRMATDAKAAAQAEARWGALAGADPAVYLNLGTGLAAAIVIGGRVLAGSHGAAGEIGYNLRDRGRRRAAGRRSGSRSRTWSAAWRCSAGPAQLGRQLTAAEVFAGRRRATRPWTT